MNELKRPLTFWHVIWFTLALTCLIFFPLTIYRLQESREEAERWKRVAAQAQSAARSSIAEFEVATETIEQYRQDMSGLKGAAQNARARYVDEKIAATVYPKMAKARIGKRPYTAVEIRSAKKASDLYGRTAESWQKLVDVIGAALLEGSDGPIVDGVFLQSAVQAAQLYKDWQTRIEEKCRLNEER